MLIVTIPHSGEIIPDEAFWLKDLPKNVLLTDVDRFVDELYWKGIQEFSIPYIKMDIHRYALDLNRTPHDVTDKSVSSLPKGYSNLNKNLVSEFHWVTTTKGEVLLREPIAFGLHQSLVEKYFKPFHEKVAAIDTKVKCKFGRRFHLDLHSMPSKGRSVHKDGGQARPDIVVSDCEQLSSSTSFKDLVIETFESLHFKVSYNWPYLGGRMTEHYGDPKNGAHSLQIELNRKLYMNESNFEKNEQFEETSQRLKSVLELLCTRVPDLL